jgi:hypothetical protein
MEIMTIWIVKGEDCEPIAFSTAKKAYDFIQKNMIQHGKDYRYDDDEIEECLNQLKHTFSYCMNGSADWFGTYLLDYDLNAYLAIIDELAEGVQ